jgi:enoyl-[acyl-carrier protein] reductase III
MPDINKQAPRVPGVGRYEELRGKSALILGGSRGIGRAISERLALEGVNLIVNYSRSKEAAEDCARSCQSLGVDVQLIQGDIGDEASLMKVINFAESQSPIDILVNNAARGLERPRSALTQKSQHLHKTMDVNLFGPWFASQTVGATMAENGCGIIINLLSPGAWKYMPGYSAVATSKAALESLTKYLGVELASSGVRVCGVSSGWVEGSDGEHSYRDEVSDRVRPHVPSGRNVAPEDIAAVVAWLSSEEAPMFSGQVLHFDGGFDLSSWRNILET